MAFKPSRRALAASFGAAAMTACTGAEGPTDTPTPRAPDALGDLDATGIAARLRIREITPREAVDAAIARTERINPQLNFLTAPLFDYARTRAATALSGPFAGVPTLVKDLLALTGAPLHFGSRAFASF